MSEPYLFVQNTAGPYRGFKIAVFATGLVMARNHIKRQAMSVIAYRSLTYVGRGPVSDPKNWLAAKA